MITRDSIETAYSFLHQKRRSTSGRLLPTGRKNVYIHSTIDWQKDENYMGAMQAQEYRMMRWAVEMRTKDIE